MRSKAVELRPQAQSDVDEAIDYYLREGAQQAALGLVDALEQAYRHLARHAATGSPKYAHELNLPGLRSWPLRRYPFLVFYIEQSACIDILRVLHSQRDVPAWMQSADES